MNYFTTIKILFIALFVFNLLSIKPTYGFYIAKNPDGTCLSYSMSHNLDCNSKFRLERYYNKEPEINDIVAFNMDTETRFKMRNIWGYDLRTAFVVHRIVGKTSTGYITKGDANEEPEPFVVKPWWIKWKVIVME